nr:MAG TPA: hypothetical protein [Caudoviricetes sp.]
MKRSEGAEQENVKSAILAENKSPPLANLKFLLYL